MNEIDLRRGLDDAVAAGSPPLALDAAGMLAHARRQRRVRLAGVSAGGTVAAALAALGVVLALPGGASSGGIGAAGQPGCQGAPSAAPAGEATATKLGTDGKPLPGQPTDAASTPPAGGAVTYCPNPSPTEWPDGQTDRTARSGPHYQKGVALQAALLAAVPAGYTTVAPSHQAQFADRVGPTDIWETMASTGIRKAGRTGTLLVVNYNADPRQADKPLCAVAAAQFGAKVSDCKQVPSGGKAVVVFSHQVENYSPRIDQWAAYRAPSGGITYVTQSKSFEDIDHPHERALTALPFTTDRLAALAVSSRLGPN
jgi:hypothetical protein